VPIRIRFSVSATFGFAFFSFFLFLLRGMRTKATLPKESDDISV
jgi:hypothetical protein